MNSYQEAFLILSIGFLVPMTVSRGIYLYYQDEYKVLENRWSNRNQEHQDNMKKLEKSLTLKQFKITIMVATFLLILGSTIKNQTIGQGLMIGALILIIFNSIFSWRFLEEGEKFTLTILSLSILLVYVYYRFTPSK